MRETHAARPQRRPRRRPPHWRRRAATPPDVLLATSPALATIAAPTTAGSRRACAWVVSARWRAHGDRRAGGRRPRRGRHEPAPLASTRRGGRLTAATPTPPPRHRRREVEGAGRTGARAADAALGALALWGQPAERRRAPLAHVTPYAVGQTSARGSRGDGPVDECPRCGGRARGGSVAGGARRRRRHVPWAHSPVASDRRAMVVAAERDRGGASHPCRRCCCG